MRMPYQCLLILLALFSASSKADLVSQLPGLALPSIMAGFEASSSISKVSMETQAALYSAQTAADVSMYQATLSAGTTIYQADVLKKMNDMRISTDRENLALQMGEIHDIAKKTRDLNRDTFKTEWELKNRLLDLKAKTDAQAIEAQAALNKKAGIEAGIIPRFTDVASVNPGAAQSSGARLLAQTTQNVSTEVPYRSGFFRKGLAFGSSRQKRNVTSDLSLFKSTFQSRPANANFLPHSSSEGAVTQSRTTGRALAPFRVH